LLVPITSTIGLSDLSAQTSGSFQEWLAMPMSSYASFDSNCRVPWHHVLGTSTKNGVPMDSMDPEKVGHFEKMRLGQPGSND